MNTNASKNNEVIARNITDLHIKALPTGFLPKLGKNFLKLLYLHILKDLNSYIYTKYINGNLAGFIVGTKSTKKLYIDFFIKNIFKSSLYIIPQILNFQTIKKIFETIMIPFKSDKSNDNIELPSAELLIVCVSEKFQRQGIASELYMNLVTYFKMEGIEQFKIIVGNNLKSAQEFYEKMGAVKLSTIITHGVHESFLYIHNL